MRIRMARKKKASKKAAPDRPIEDPNNVAERQRAYKERRRERSETRVSVWVPAERAQQLRDIATMWRREGELRDGLTSRTPGVQIPKVEIPELPPPGYAWIRVEEDELAMQKLLKLNGGEWHWRRGAWRIRSDLVERMGLRSRVCSPAEYSSPPPSHRRVESLPAPRIPPAAPKPSRNGPCPCGSGKKYKRCCADR